MLSKNNQGLNDVESGFTDVETQQGHRVRVFALTAQEFERAKPNEEAFRRVAAIMADSEKEIVTHHVTSSDRSLSNKDRILQIVKG